MTIYLTLLVALIGLLIYVLSSNPKIAECGRIMFGTGLLAFLLCICHGTVSLLQR